ncbi:hypothetical protein HD595_000146 [Nonomuraea roseoviolacea subsp. carminata]|uniref:DUF2637 domain-containing protein n=2 Tax=Nonomuraea TaxID=83681 RepID=A0ABT1JQN6_9ACTN|nr:hypothetical protein [Nonomuraea roseoviolacea subsp. carminata]
MRHLALQHGEDLLAATLIPLAVDGTIVAASMSLLLASRYGSRGGFLPWALLILSSLASLGVNIAVAEPTLIGRLIAGWPGLALIGAYEMLMSQIRASAQSGLPPEGEAEVDEDGAHSEEDQSGRTAPLQASNGRGGLPGVVVLRLANPQDQGLPGVPHASQSGQGQVLAGLFQVAGPDPQPLGGRDMVAVQADLGQGAQVHAPPLEGARDRLGGVVEVTGCRV